MTKKISKSDKDALVLHLKAIVDEGTRPYTPPTPLLLIDYAHTMCELSSRHAKADLARYALMKMHEIGMIDLSEYRTD